MITTRYWPKDSNVEVLLDEMLTAANARGKDREDLQVLLGPLKLKNQDHYEHSVRVAVLAYSVAREMGLDARAMLYAGLMHDVGKALVSGKVLGKDKDWTAADAEAIKTHVGDGFRLLRDRFDFTAEIMVWHPPVSEKLLPDRGARAAPRPRTGHPGAHLVLRPAVGPG